LNFDFTDLLTDEEDGKDDLLNGVCVEVSVDELSFDCDLLIIDVIERREPPIEIRFALGVDSTKFCCDPCINDCSNVGLIQYIVISLFLLSVRVVSKFIIPFSTNRSINPCILRRFFV
jgi:hypothetical protein